MGLQLSFLAWKFFLMQDRAHLFYRATCKGKVSSFPFRRLYKQASLANLFRKEMKKKLTLENTYRIEVESVRRFLVFIRA